MNALFIFAVGMQLLKIAIKTANMMFRDVGRSYLNASGALYQNNKSLLQVVFYKCASTARALTKSKGNFQKGGGAMSCGINFNAVFVFISLQDADRE